MSNSWWLEPAQAINAPMREAALARQQQLTKPAGSLAQLERLAVQLAGLQGRERPAADQVW
ncbi:nicotinate-nucleotide--dimethylbenzimidazole phosphoribosyltransferase, partial [Pseudomonas viridiflava]